MFADALNWLRKSEPTTPELRDTLRAYIIEADRPAFNVCQNAMLDSVRTAAQQGTSPLHVAARNYVMAYDTYDRHAARRAFNQMVALTN